MLNLESTIPLLPWLTYTWNEVAPAMFDWVSLVPANKYRVTLACWNSGGDWVINPEKSVNQTGIPVADTDGHVKLLFKDYGTFMQQEFFAYDTTASGTIWTLEVIWKPLIRSD